MHGAMLHVIPKGRAGYAKGVIFKILKRSNIRHGSMFEVEPTMEDVFVKLVRG